MPEDPGSAGTIPGLQAPGVVAAGTSLDLDINADPRAAAQQYQDVLSAFDSQREGAAHAVFGLGEAYRKLGRLDEARAQYGRILREFVDFPELARQSQRILSENRPRTGAIVQGSAVAEAQAEERDLLLQELQLLEHSLERAKAGISQGVENPGSAVPIQREILQLKQRLARLRIQEKPEAGRP